MSIRRDLVELVRQFQGCCANDRKGHSVSACINVSEELIASGRLRVVQRRSDQLTAAEKEVGEELATLLDTATADGGVVVRSAPVSKLGSYLDENADMSRCSAVMTDTHAALELLSAGGKIDGTTRQRAETHLQYVDRGWDDKPAIKSDSALYLDDLAVTYLDYVGLLDALVGAVGSVFVHEYVSEHVQQTLRYSEHTSELLPAIDHVREVLAGGVESGRITFSSRRSSADRMEDDKDPRHYSPTLDLLFDLTGKGVAVADDRCLTGELAAELFAVIATSCAVYEDSRHYREAMGEQAARACFIILEDKESLGDLVVVFNFILERDERLRPGFAKALAVARTKLARA